MITWSVVTENVREDDLLRKKLRQKIGKLERHLRHFPPDTVHLQIALARHARKELYRAGLTLRVPHNLLRSEKAAFDLIAAFDNAMKALLRELEKLKEQLRREPEWKRKQRRQQLHEGFTAEPMATGTGPQTVRDVVAALLEKEEAALLRHLRRLLRQHELTGELPPGAMDARAVVDEVARQALAAPDDKPDDRSYRVWLYDLARRELQRRIRAWREESREKLPVEPPVETTPDVEVARKDWLEYLQHASKNWPADERAVLELYFVEGFEPEEVAMLLKRPRKEVDALIGAVQTRLRWEMARER
jgi:ribosomal subunit interface protein